MKLCLKRDLNEMKKKAKQMNEGITFQVETKASTMALRPESGKFELLESKEANVNAVQ